MDSVQALTEAGCENAAKAATIHCDQAIFTSIRSPNGEGYRIITASCGLRPEEKQTITRYSPSHGGLCDTGEVASPLGEVAAISFYPLPSERVCVALSCLAGAEHTGRGGQRVFTRSLVFDPLHLARICYNPFNILRSLAQADLTSPNLSPPPTLPQLELPLVTSHSNFAKGVINGLAPARRGLLLQALFENSNLILEVKSHWLALAEIILLGIPGPMRMKLSFAAGVRFSAGRTHRLHVISDDKGETRRRVIGQPVRMIDEPSEAIVSADASSWNTFVERMWSEDKLTVLSRRTSLPFSDVSPLGRERAGRLCLSIENLASTATPRILIEVAEHFGELKKGCEADIITEYFKEARQVLLGRFAQSSWTDRVCHWPVLTGLWRRTQAGRSFAEPLLEQILAIGLKENPIAAAEAALVLAADVPPFVDRSAHERWLQSVLTQLADWTNQADDASLQQLPRVLNRWFQLRPHCPIVDRLRMRCSKLAAAHP